MVLLQRVVVESGQPPLVLALDNGSENLGDVLAWCRERGVILLRNLPHTPQHNAWVEYGNGELKQHSGLGKDQLILDVHDIPTLPLNALERIDGEIPRASRGWRTARETYRAMPSAQRLVDRSELLREAHCAVAEAVQGSCTWRQRRLAEREAILQVLERPGLVTRTRGRLPRSDAKPDDVS